VTGKLLLVVMVAGASALGCACRQPTPSPTVTAATPAAPAQSPAATPGGLGGTGGQTVARQYLVTVVAGAGEAAVREALAPLGLTAVRPIGNDTFLVTLGEDPGLPKVEALARQDARIRAVQPNFVYRAN
jgi:hypothetical protein